MLLLRSNLKKILFFQCSEYSLERYLYLSKLLFLGLQLSQYLFDERKIRIKILKTVFPRILTNLTKFQYFLHLLCTHHKSCLWKNLKKVFQEITICPIGLLKWTCVFSMVTSFREEILKVNVPYHIQMTRIFDHVKLSNDNSY